MKDESDEDIETTVEEMAPVTEERDAGRVRDLLFASEPKGVAGAGAQFSFAFLHRKLDRLEDRIATENNQVREEMRGRMEDLERLFKSELASMVEALADEEQRRIKALNKISSDLKAVTRVFEDRAAGMEERFSDIDQNVLRTVKVALSDTEGRLKALSNRMEKDTRQLQEGKADSSRLAELFTEFAQRMNEPPDKR